MKKVPIIEVKPTHNIIKKYVGRKWILLHIYDFDNNKLLHKEAMEKAVFQVGRELFVSIEGKHIKVCKLPVMKRN